LTGEGRVRVVPAKINNSGGTMIVGVLTVSLEIPESNSLKDKRQVIRSLLDGLRLKFNVSAAEMDRLDSQRFATIGVACISNSKSFTNQVLDSVIRKIEANPRVVVLDHSIEFI
jgi:uncharacterized protein